jgi:hypothetical protein
MLDEDCLNIRLGDYFESRRFPSQDRQSEETAEDQRDAELASDDPDSR